MGKTVRQLGELIQILVENGVINSNTNLTSDDYVHLVFSARDYLLYQRKINNLTLTNSQVVQVPKAIKIINGRATFEENFNVQGIDGAVLLDKGGHKMNEAIYPLSQSAEQLVDNIFPYYLLSQSYTEFKNLPHGADKIQFYTVAGSSEDDIISEDMAFMIIQQVMKLGQMSETAKVDTSHDGNNQDDALRAQVRQLINTPNTVV